MGQDHLKGAVWAYLSHLLDCLPHSVAPRERAPKTSRPICEPQKSRLYAVKHFQNEGQKTHDDEPHFQVEKSFDLAPGILACRAKGSPLESQRHLHENTRAVGVGQGQRSPPCMGSSGAFEIGQQSPCAMIGRKPSFKATFICLSSRRSVTELLHQPVQRKFKNHRAGMRSRKIIASTTRCAGSMFECLEEFQGKATREKN